MVFINHAESVGEVPKPEELAKIGVGVTGKGKEKASEDNTSKAAKMLAALEAAGEVREKERAVDPTQCLVPTGGGLCELSKKLLEKIQAEEYVDFNELPPAKGKGRSLAQGWEGQVVVVQAADLVKPARSFLTWPLGYNVQLYTWQCWPRRSRRGC